MQFRDTILYGCDTLTIEKVYDTLFSKKTMKHIGYERGSLKSNSCNKVCNCCKKKGRIKKDCYKLQNKEKLDVNQKGKQPDTLTETDIIENCLSAGELLVIYEGDSKPDDDRIFDTTCTFHMCPNRGICF